MSLNLSLPVDENGRKKATRLLNMRHLHGLEVDMVIGVGRVDQKPRKSPEPLHPPFTKAAQR